MNITVNGVPVTEVGDGLYKATINGEYTEDGPYEFTGTFKEVTDQIVESQGEQS